MLSYSLGYSAPAASRSAVGFKPCDLVGVAAFEPAASSSRTQVHRSAGRYYPWADLLRLSTVVRGSSWTNVAIVTQLVTQAALGDLSPPAPVCSQDSLSGFFAGLAANACCWRRGNRLDAYRMAIMRAVATAAPSSSVQATAWTSGICWSSALAGGSLPVIRRQPIRATFWAASTAISPAASFSARTEGPSPFSAIGVPRAAAEHRGHPQRLCALSSHSTLLGEGTALETRLRLILGFYGISAKDAAGSRRRGPGLAS